jgi:hypothetical protein
MAMLIALSAPAFSADDAEAPAAVAPAGAEERPLSDDASLKPLDDISLGDERFSSSGAAWDDIIAGLKAGQHSLQRPSADQGDVPIASPLLTAPSFMHVGRP